MVSPQVTISRRGHSQSSRHHYQWNTCDTSTLRGLSTSLGSYHRVKRNSFHVVSHVIGQSQKSVINIIINFHSDGVDIILVVTMTMFSSLEGCVYYYPAALLGPSQSLSLVYRTILATFHVSEFTGVQLCIIDTIIPCILIRLLRPAHFLQPNHDGHTT